MPRMSYRQAIHDALQLEMRRDDSVVVMGEDIVGGKGASGEQDAWGGAFGVTKGLIGEFGPDRVLDTGSDRGRSRSDRCLVRAICKPRAKRGTGY